MRRAILLAALAFVCLLYLRFSCAPAPKRPEMGIIPVLNEDEVATLMKAPTVQELTAAMEKIRPLHQKIRPPGPHDWLANHPERGQTFMEYLQINPVTPRGIRNTLYIQPLGKFTDTQRKIVTLTADFMGRYFNVPVKIRDDLPLDVIPAEQRRIGPLSLEQIRTGYVLDYVLRPRLPEDAAAYLAFTASDLWPGPGWNFVFGQAALFNRVGVWSICRFGSPETSEVEFRRTLLRTLKTGTHETGHMFSMLHCIAYECNMCGSNHLAESDRRPVYLCPECMAKVCWAAETDPISRYRKLAEFCKKHGLKEEQEFYEKSVRRLAVDGR